ncbi:MAG: hypothetical protein ACTSV5_00530 [Promethearchaeota archaeon]
MNHDYSPFPLTTGSDNLFKFMVRVHEDNKDLIIDSIETLFDKKIIISNIN